MKVLMVSLDYMPTVGGISAHVYELSQALKSLGCDVSVATKLLSTNQKSFENIDGICVYRFKLPFLGLLYGYKINQFINILTKKEKFDIIHIHGMRPLEFYNVPNIPLVYTNHTSGYLKRIKKGGYRIALLKRLFKKPQLFLAPSEELLKVPFSFSAKKTFIPNGVVSEKFTRNDDVRTRLRQELKIKNDEKLAIVTRRMVWKNGVNFLALATQYIKNKKLKILFIGDGEQYDEIKAVLEKNFSERFIMLGSKKHEEIIDYYSAADLSILPSLMEAISISGLEAMASSLPLVGTRVGGIPVLIKEGENGCLCESEDAKDLAEKIDMLLSKDIKTMGDSSRKMAVDNFSWTKAAQKTLDSYKEVI